MSVLGCDGERCGTSQCLRISVTASSDELLRYGSMSIFGRAEDRRGPIRILVVDQGLRAGRGEQRPNSRCVAITRSQ